MKQANIIVKSILEQTKSKVLNAGDANRLLLSYRDNRGSAQIRDWRNETGDKARVMANGVDKLVNDVSVYLRSLDAMTYYPFVVDGAKCVNRDEVLEQLIKMTKENK